MKTFTKILTVLLLGCSVVCGQSKKDIEDFKVKYPKTEENAIAHINSSIGGIKNNKILKSIPFVKGSIKEKYNYVEYSDYSYKSSDYIDLSLLGTLYPFCIERSAYEHETEKKQKLYDEIVLDLPKSIKEDATHYLPKGSKFDVWFVIFDVNNDKLNSLELRTNPKMKIENEPLRFRNLLDKCYTNEKNKVTKILKSSFDNGDGYVFVKVYIEKPDVVKKDAFGGITKIAGRTETMFGWIKLSDLVKQKIFDKKK